MRRAKTLLTAPRTSSIHMYMSQLNINMTPEFEELLRQYMEMNKIPRKSEAIRHAIAKGVKSRHEKAYDFREWITLAKKLPKVKPHHPDDEDQLWEKGPLRSTRR